MSKDLAEHLSYFAELGVEGVSRDAAWRQRVDTPAAGSTMAATVPSDGPPATAAAGAVDPDLATNPAAPVLPPDQALMALKIEIGPHCMRCKLCRLGRSQVVFGVGHPRARLMFVGEAPGEDEDRQGEPFVGRAGQLLTKIVEAISLTREQVYIANVIKCRPPGNRNPEPDEVATCEPFLFRQIEIIQPRVIVALGKFAAQCLLKSDAPITRIRGREFTYRDSILIPTYHPAYLLRNPSAKKDVWGDMKKVRALLSQDAPE